MIIMIIMITFMIIISSSSSNVGKVRLHALRHPFER
jgi:hypothetical protein